MSVEVMRSVIDAAEGRVPVDTLFTNAQIVDVYGQRVAPGSVAVKDGVIVGVLYDGRDDAADTYEAAEVIDCQNRYIAPGFIDGHLHIESSNIRPAEYARMAATRGTTTAIADSHEIANVAGLGGLRFMIEDGRRAPISIKYMMPSCVPALPDEQAGAVITAADMQAFFAEHPGDVFGLGEMMNLPGVFMADPETALVSTPLTRRRPSRSTVMRRSLRAKTSTPTPQRALSPTTSRRFPRRRSTSCPAACM